MLAEMALAFPVHVLLTLGILQLGLLSVGRAHAKVAAFAAARAALAEPPPGSSGPRRPRPDPARAARTALLPVTGTTLFAAAGPSRLAPSATLARVGGVARLADPLRQAAARAKTRVSVERSPVAVRATVLHDFELTVPGVGWLFSKTWVRAGGDASVPARYRAPHIRIEEVCELRRK